MNTRRGPVAFACTAAGIFLAASLGLSSHAIAAPPTATSSDCGTQNLLAGQQPWQRGEIEGSVALVTDGTVGAEGARWDAPIAITFNSASAYLTYDLGRSVSVSAIFLQADANDTYQIAASRDGAPGSFQPLVTVEDAMARGHGLRTRAVRFAPTTARFIRVGEATGDGRFSISELAAYCAVPSPFPPAMKTVDVPLAEAPRPTAPPKTTLPEDADANPLLLAIAAILAVFGAASMLRARGVPRRDARRDGGRDAELTSGESAEAEATTGTGVAGQEVGRDRTRSDEARLRLMFLGSGCAALIYEVVWLHLLRLVIGASALSVAIVLASFMGGMFLGSLFFARYVRGHRHPLRIYALLELGIGAFGVLMPLVLPAVRFIYVGLVGYGALGIALRAVIAAVLLLPPTALMGATLPAIARRYSPGPRGMSGLAGLYAANTIGAVLGSLLSAFYLLAVWDVWIATIAAAALNAVIAAYAFRVSRHAPRRIEEPAKDLASSTSADLAGSDGAARTSTFTRSDETALRYIYAGAALSGLTALGAQVIWTRLLTLLFGATVYAFAIILAVFLGGLGLGSAFAAYLLRRGRRGLDGLAWSQVLLVPALLFGAFVLGRLLPFSALQSYPWIPEMARHGLHILRAVDVILPAAILWGMSFPFALAAAGASHADTARSSGNVYAANTIGAIVGALGISFWAIPRYGTRWAEQALAVLAAVSAALLFAGVRRHRAADARSTTAKPGVGSKALSPALVLAIGLAAAALIPGLSRTFLAHGRYIWWVDPRDEYPYVAEGAASTVAVHVGADGYRNFHVSGRVEATNNPNDLRTQRLIGHLSAIPHPHPESVLVVGLGGGMTAGTLALYPEVKRIVICEIEPRVVGAARQFDKENYAVLSDPRVQLVFDDARHFLATTREKFDIITSDPIHPWVRGNSILFSREYYAIVKSRLKPGGIATQWVPLYETSELAIKIQLRTFMDAFANGTVWNTITGGKGYDVVLVGSVEPLHIDVATTARRMSQNPRMLDSFREVRLNSAVELLASYGASGHDMQRWLAGAPINRDFSLKLEYISGVALDQREADAIYAHMVADRSFPAEVFTGPAEEVQELRRRILGLAAATP